MRGLESQKPAAGYITGTHSSSVDDSAQPFALWVPTTYTPRRAYPLIVALHGSDASERMIPEDCFQIHRRGFREDVLLLCPFGRGDLAYEWMGETDLWEAMAWVKTRYRVDARRQYLTGLSMGGFACWRLGCAYPDHWAAIAPICGWGQPADLIKLKRTPVWCVHGQRDADVPACCSRELVAELRRLRYRHRYHELEGWGHNAWEWLYDPCRQDDTLVDWFLRHRRRAAPPPILKPKRRGQLQDIFSERVIISYPATSSIPNESEFLRVEAEQIAQFSFGDTGMRTGRLLVKPDTALTDDDLAQANHLMLGRTDNHARLRQVKHLLLARHQKGRLQVEGENYLGKTLVAATWQKSPWNQSRLLAVITYQQFRQMHGLTKQLFAPQAPLLRVNLFDTDQKRFILQANKHAAA